MALHSPVEFSEIVESYVDGWRKTGWMPECRTNNVPGYTQGGELEKELEACLASLHACFSTGSDGDNIVSHFAITYHNEASELGVDINDIYSALQADADVNPLEWDIHGRQVNVFK